MSLRHNYTENKKKERKKEKGKRFPPPSCRYLRDPSLEIPLLEFTKRNRSKRFGTTVGRISTTAEQIRATVPGTGIVRLSRGYRYTLLGQREREILFTKLSIERGTQGTAQFEQRGIFMTPVSTLSLFGRSDPRMGS